ncbi:hypothetical protein [Pseudomonas antarctica]|uniref:hypothetical protein n=1 Tax=Pseudomonas antarctica TaxID=219572 RepID=UPI00387AE45F
MSAPVILITGGSRGVGAANDVKAAGRRAGPARSGQRLHPHGPRRPARSSGAGGSVAKTDLLDIGMVVMALVLKQRQAGK